ncbi:MAG TPA: glycoside hydrolase family 88 protein [Vicinamibacterales bacterium]|nr:glycoside hydrolase family 88 protein [Vicinamibacterales bacterium]
MPTLDRRSFADTAARARRVFDVSADKITSIERAWDPGQGAPVFTVEGRYRARGWTEWTQGFQFGSALLQFDATGDAEFLALGRSRTLERMAPHLTHSGVHDHGFNTISTYGTLWRLAREGRIGATEWETRVYALAIQASGAVQARRWTHLPDGGFIHSFNGPHSLFVDTMRTLRVLALAWRLGHVLLEEQDARANLLERLLQHARTTARYSVYYGEGRDRFDVRGRVAHESVFNPVNGSYRGPATQQGYSPFTTWTRGLAWAILGFAEQLEFLDTLNADAVRDAGGSEDGVLLNAAKATADYYIESAAASDGVPYWDDGAPGLAALGDWRARPADPYNDREPVDSSAAVIAAQGLLRLARVVAARGEPDLAIRYEQSGLRIADTLFDPDGPYLSTSAAHQGLLLHSVYHWPNGWDYVPEGARIPRGESSQWGDYHARELALYILRLADGKPYLSFFGPRT